MTLEHRPIALLEDWTSRLLATAGVAHDDARIVAQAIVRTEARGVVTHGLARLPTYLDKLRSGEYNPRPQIEIKAHAGALRMDADGAMGQLAGVRAIEACCERARESAAVMCFARDLGHLGAVGLYPLIAAECGMVAIAIARTPPILALPGARGPLIGHSPIAFAAPIANADPIVVDMAASVAARGHILLAAERGEPIPPGWALDAAGVPTTDAIAARDGMLLPMGDHKGLAIAMLGELLAGSLAGDLEDRTAMRGSGPDRRVTGAGALGGQTAFFCVINPALASDATTFATLAADWVAHFAANAGDSARLPGSRAAVAERNARSHGVPIAADMLARLQMLGRRESVPLDT